MKNLNILLITSDKYPPFRPAAKAIFGEEFTQNGHRIDWLMQADERRNSETRDWRSLTVVPFGNGKAYVGGTDPGNSRWSRIVKHLKDIGNDLRMVSLVRRQSYDLIQVKDKYLSAIFAAGLAKVKGIPFFYWIAFPHGEASLLEADEGIARYPLFYRIRGHVLRFLLYRLILPAADHAFVQSEQMKDDFAAEGVPREKMTAVPSSINLSDIPYQDGRVRPAEAGDEAPRIVYLGTLNRMRRLDFVVRAFKKVHDRLPQAILYFVGKGDMEEDEKFLKREIESQGLTASVVFTGHLPMQEAWEFVRTADVCLSPYFPTQILKSTSPTKLVEYMAMGRPVVANDHPEQDLVLRETRAGFSVPWDEQAFANAIVQVLNDPAEAAEMGRRGRQYIEQHRTNAALAHVVEEQYLRICGALDTRGRQPAGGG